MGKKLILRRSVFGFFVCFFFFFFLEIRDHSMIVRPYNDIAHVKLTFNQFAVSKKKLISMRTKMSDDENRHDNHNLMSFLS